MRHASAQLYQGYCTGVYEFQTPLPRLRSRRPSQSSVHTWACRPDHLYPQNANIGGEPNDSPRGAGAIRRPGTAPLHRTQQNRNTTAVHPDQLPPCSPWLHLFTARAWLPPCRGVPLKPFNRQPAPPVQPHRTTLSQASYAVRTWTTRNHGEEEDEGDDDNSIKLWSI